MSATGIAQMQHLVVEALERERCALVLFDVSAQAVNASSPEPVHHGGAGTCRLTDLALAAA